jgi:hypothetical protein
MANGQEVADRLGKPANSGIPWLVILDAAGEKLINSDGPKGNIGYPFEPREIEFFLTMLKATATRMGDEQLAEVEAILKENAERIRSLRRPGNGQLRRLKVLYVGNSDSERAKEFDEFLHKHFDSVRIANRSDFDPKSASDCDVVLLDWSQRDSDVRKAVSPFGDLKSWSKPTVLLGSAGLLLAGCWDLIGGAG